MNQQQLSSALSIILALILSSIPVILGVILYADYVTEETYLHAGFILGLLNGEGFSFTGHLTYGTISPLWIIMGSFISIITDDPLFSLRFLSAVFSIISVLLFLKIADVIKLRSSVKFIAAISFVLNPFFLRWSVSGLEITAAMAMLLFLIYAYSDRYHVRHPYIYGLLLGGATLLRPEFILLTIIFVLYIFILNKHHHIKALKTLITWLGVILCWVAFTYFHFETIIPNIIKTNIQSGFFTFTIGEAVTNIKLMLGGNIPEFLILTIIVVVIFILSSKRDQQFTEEFIRLLERLRFNGMIIGVIFFITLYVYFILKGISIQQFTIALIPVLILTTASLVNLLSDYKSKFNLSLIAIYLVLVLIIHTHITFTVIKPAGDIYVKGFQNSYKEIANFIKTDENDESKTVALSNTGIVGFYSGASTFDLSGLTDNERFDYKSDYDYIIDKKPNYLVIKEEKKLSRLLQDKAGMEIIYQREVPDYEINDNGISKLTLYRISWD